MNLFKFLFDTSGFPARWRCGSGWTDDPWLGWLHILSDVAVWAAYFAIPGILIYFLLRRKDLPFSRIFLLFGAFILACGTTHLMEAVIFWWPAYGLAGVIKLATAIVSWGTVLALVQVAPQALAMRSPAELEKEIAARRQAEAALQRSNDELESRVRERTAELVEVNSALQNEREWLQTTLASIGDAVIATDVDGRVKFLNPVAASLTGWIAADAHGRPVEEVLRIVNELTRHSTENPVVRALTEGVTVGLANHTLLISRDGVERPIEDSAAPIRDEQGTVKGAVLVFRDVNERRQQENRLRAAEEQFRTLANSIPQLAWIAEPDGFLSWYNRRWYDYTGTTPDQMEGWGWQSVHDPQELPRVLERWQASIATGETFDIVFPIRGKDGQFREFLTRAEPVRDPDGRLLRWFGTNTDISEAKRIEAELRDARSRLDSTLAAAYVGTWEFDVLNNTVYADQNLARMYGVTPAEQNGGPIEAYVRAIHPDDRERVQRTRDECLATGQDYESEYRLVGADGAIRWVVSRARIERDPAGRPARIPGVVVDITERKQAEEREHALLTEASTANAKFRALFDQGEIFAAIMDVDGTIIEPNRLSWEGCGYAKDQIIGKPFWECPWWSPSSELVERIKVASAQAAAGQTYRAEIPYFVADGSQRILDLIILPIKDETGRVVFLAPTGTDITHRRQLENDLRQSAADLSAADRRKDEFLATLAHELRNPLAPIRTGLEIMRLAEGEKETVEQARSLMERQLTQLVRLVDDLIDVSRITRGKIGLRREAVPLADVIRNAVDASRPLIDEMQHQLTVTPPREPIMLDGDPTRLAQILINLLNNAAKYSDKGGHISLSAERHESDVVISVKDAGIGIAAEHLPHIFDMFTQADRSLDKSQGGLGIGLTLVKRLVEMHGGSIEAHSAGLSQGSEFIVRLPVLSQPSQPPTATNGRDNPTPKSSFRILVVDDNRDGASTLAMMLKIIGNETRIAHDGPEAIEMAREFLPDVVLLDIGLPTISGLDVCRKIRQQPWGQKMVLIAVTGWGQEEDQRRSQAAGFNHHLTKPVDPKSLMTLLAQLTENSRK